jgi:hypothetical protein
MPTRACAVAVAGRTRTVQVKGLNGASAQRFHNIQKRPAIPHSKHLSQKHRFLCENPPT